MATIRNVLTTIVCILVAYLIADFLSLLIVRIAGLSGPLQFVAGFVTFALIFFTILYGIQRMFGVFFFNFFQQTQS